MIIGTAGHIDHGKSSLVEALTGTRMDRLREERERGITIELNFAPFPLSDGRTAGVVDVPGHEDFVRTMVAGASGIDLVLLVIAADEGIKPQTREHLAIAEQLGIRRGLPVITKADLVEGEWASLVELEVMEWLKGSSIHFDSPQTVSVASGKGIAELTARLHEVASTIPARNSSDLFRLPVDRVFSVAGIGTVITGTTWSGRLAPGDPVMVLPTRTVARVRTIQSHGKDTTATEPGMRVALGLAGVGRDEIRRGDIVVDADAAWEASLAFDVSLTLLPSAPRPLSSRSRVRLHLGTSEIIARVLPRNGRVEPGSTGLARMTLESPGVARGGDRFVVRAFSPVTTIGGGRVIDPCPPRRKATWPVALDDQQAERRLDALVERRPNGVQVAQLPVLLGETPREIDRMLAGSDRYVLAGEYWIHQSVVDQLAQATLEKVNQFHHTHPQERGIPLAEMRQNIRAAQWVSGAVLEQLERSGRLTYQDGIARLAGFQPRVEGGNEQTNRVVDHIRLAGLTPPTTEELSRALAMADLTATLRLAAGEGRLEPVERDRYYSREALERFVATLVELGSGGTITPGQVRDQLGISRKFLIPLLEWSDAKGITVRAGEGRRLRPGQQLPWRVPAP